MVKIEITLEILDRAEQMRHLSNIKLDLIDLYADMGFPYFDMIMQELDEDMAVFRSCNEEDLK